MTSCVKNSHPSAAAAATPARYDIFNFRTLELTTQRERNKSKRPRSKSAAFRDC